MVNIFPWAVGHLYIFLVQFSKLYSWSTGLLSFPHQLLFSPEKAKPPAFKVLLSMWNVAARTAKQSLSLLCCANIWKLTQLAVRMWGGYSGSHSSRSTWLSFSSSNFFKGSWFHHLSICRLSHFISALVIKTQCSVFWPKILFFFFPPTGIQNFISVEESWYWEGQWIT